jgi:hypothetical protein
MHGTFVKGIQLDIGVARLYPFFEITMSAGGCTDIADRDLSF